MPENVYDMHGIALSFKEFLKHRVKCELVEDDNRTLDKNRQCGCYHVGYYVMHSMIKRLYPLVCA